MKNTHIKLIPCTQAVIAKILKGDQYLAAFLEIEVPPNWSEFGDVIFEFTLKKLDEFPGEEAWWAYLPILKDSKTLVGSCGFKGPPFDGSVEIGYEIAKPFRNRGLATECVELLCHQAFSDSRVQSVIAHTLASRNASTVVLEKCGFQKIGEFEDEEDGLLWKWQKSRKMAQL